MNAIETMMKSFGVDPAKIKEDLRKTLDEITAAVMAEVKEIKESQLRTEENTKKILFLLAKPEPETGGSLDSMNRVASEPESEQHAERLTDGGSFDSTS